MRFLRNLASLVLSDAVSKIVHFVAFAYLARVLGAEGLGVVNWVQSVVLSFALIPNFGLNEYGILKVAPDRSPESIRSVLHDIVGFRLVAGFATIIILAVTTFAFPGLYEFRVLLLTGGGFLVATIFAVDWLYIAMERQLIVGTFRIVSRLLYLGGVFAFVRAPDDVMAALIAAISGEFFFSCTLMMYSRHEYSWNFSWPDGLRLKRTLREAWPLALYIGSSAVMYSVDLMILGTFLPMRDAGLYSGVFRIFSFFIGAKYLIGQMIYPKVVRQIKEHEVQQKTLGRFVDVLNRYALLLALVTAFPLVLFSREVTLLILGAEFSDASILLLLFSFALFAEIGWLQFPYIVVSHNKNFYGRLMLIMTLLKVAALMVVVPIGGLIGAALVHVAVTGLFFFSCVYYTQSRILPHWSTKQSLWPLPILVASGLLIWFEPFGKVLAGAVGVAAVSYLCFYSLRGGINTFKEESRLIIG